MPSGSNSDDWSGGLPPADSLASAEDAAPLDRGRLHSEQLQLLGTAVRVTDQGIAILTPAVEAAGPRIAFVNDGFCTILGRTRDEIIGQTPQIFGIVERQNAIFDALLQHVFEGRPFEAEVTARRASGAEFEL
ncbi:MAG TPA: PAS domain-containing protein, partial [Thermoanaerobaculia bacterium]|nr:PAS domain-containing protein [Thermoanaerobaculia bacterium]